MHTNLKAYLVTYLVKNNAGQTLATLTRDVVSTSAVGAASSAACVLKGEGFDWNALHLSRVIDA